MNPALFIPMMALMIPIVAILSSVVVKPWFRLKEREMELRAEHTAEKAAQYAAHSERLEQRVRVLERIATDRGADLADEIDRLREAPPLPRTSASGSTEVER